MLHRLASKKEKQAEFFNRWRYPPMEASKLENDSWVAPAFIVPRVACAESFRRIVLLGSDQPRQFLESLSVAYILSLFRPAIPFRERHSSQSNATFTSRSKHTTPVAILTSCGIQLHATLSIAFIPMPSVMLW
jgi:hypothetical protein